MSGRFGRADRVSAFLTGAAILSATTILVSAVNYGLTFALARLLPPAQFGDATLAITLVLAAAVIAATLQLVAARTVAADPASAVSVRRVLVRAAAIAGLAAAVLLGVGAWFLAEALRTSTPWMFVIIGAGLPIYFVQAVHRGLLQGGLRFGRLALSYGAEAAARAAVVLGLVAAGFGVIGAAIGIFVSFVASAAVARTRRPRHERGVAMSGVALRVTAIAAVTMLLAQTLLNNADLVLAKAAFDPRTAGVYAAAAVLCRSLYFVSWSIVQALVPVLASASSTSGERRRALAGAIGVIAGLGGAAALAVSLLGESLMRVLFGAAYASGSALLLPYTLATSLLSLATLLAAVDVARGRSGGPALLLGGAVMQLGVLAVAGDTPASMAWLQVATTGVTLCALAAARLVRGHRESARTSRPALRRSPLPTTTTSPTTKTARARIHEPRAASAATSTRTTTEEQRSS